MGTDPLIFVTPPSRISGSDILRGNISEEYKRAIEENRRAIRTLEDKEKK